MTFFVGNFFILFEPDYEDFEEFFAIMPLLNSFANMNMKVFATTQHFFIILNHVHTDDVYIRSCKVLPPKRQMTYILMYKSIGILRQKKCIIIGITHV